MCGITAVWLKDGNAVPVVKKLLIGLKNHGVSSSGMAWQDGDEVKVKKIIGPPDNLNNGAEANVVVGHTRMPSIGNVSLDNAHPFKACDGSFALVHNGTFFNKDFLKKLLESEHTIKGQTDSEIMTHYIEEKKDRVGYEAALSLFENQRLLLVTKDKIIGYGDLVVIQDKDGVYVTNDEAAMSEIFDGKEKSVYRLWSDSILIIKDGRIKILGKKVEPKRRVMRQTALLESSFEPSEEEDDDDPEDDDDDVIKSAQDLDRVAAQNRVRRDAERQTHWWNKIMPSKRPTIIFPTRTEKEAREARKHEETRVGKEKQRKKDKRLWANQREGF